jgi:hypothetical protein
LHADNNININAKKNLNVSAENINVNADQNFGLRAGGNYNAYALGNFSVKVNGSMSMGAGGPGSYASSGAMFLNGSKLNLNSGSTSAAPTEVQPIPIIAHTDTLYDATKGYAAAPGKLMSIVSRAPAPSINATRRTTRDSLLLPNTTGNKALINGTALLAMINFIKLGNLLNSAVG